MLKIVLQTAGQIQQHEHASGPLEIGRGPARGVPRIEVEDPYVSRDHLRLEEIEPGRVRVENLSRKNLIDLDNAPSLCSGATCILDLPARLKLGQTSLRIERCGSPALTGLQTILPPLLIDSSLQRAKLDDLGKAPPADLLTHWLERVFIVQTAAAGSAEFFEEAARAIVDIVGLGSSCVLLKRPRGWEVAARYPAHPFAAHEFSRTVLSEVVRNRRTFYQTSQLPLGAGSLTELEAVVASPIFDDQGEVLGALYGSRVSGIASGAPAISNIEAQVVQLLAAAVGTGLSRKEREAQAARMRIQFEQFFSVELAQELERDPSLLEGREREITVLFADLRGFSAIAERLGPGETFRLMGDVMDCLSGCIVKLGGVIIDYYGDGLAVMWNAPSDQADHAKLAARAALELRAEIPELNARWGRQLGTPLDLGIGLHTGMALVGNCGSRRRLKYGPRGHVVNLASRLEQATKQFRAPILLSGETAARLGNEFSVRRLCRARLAGVSGAIDLFELHQRADDLAYAAQTQDYARALADFESGTLPAAADAFAQLAAQGDMPSKLLLAQIRKELEVPSAEFQGVVALDSK